MRFQRKRPPTIGILRSFLYSLLAVALATGAWACGDDADVVEDEHGHEEGAHEEGEEHHEGEEHTEGEEGHDEHAEEGVIEMTPAMMQEAGINVEPVRQGSTSTTFTAPATVASRGDAMARVGTIIPGRVVRLLVSEGAYVARGAALAEIEALEVGSTRAEYLSAVAQEERTRQALERQRRLANEKIGAARTLEEAEAEHEQAVAERKAAAARLQSFGIDPQKAGSSFSNRITVRAPIAGMISEREVTLGEFVAAEDDLFTMVNTGTIWIEARLQPAQAARLNIGATGFARAPSGERVSGRVVFISPIVDPESRTTTVRIEAPNSGGVFRPGAFVTAEFEAGAGRAAIVVPTTALEREGNSFYIYRLHDENAFERVLVDVVQQNDDRAVIRSGLEEGDRIAVSGIFYLKSARMQGELSEHHH